MDRNAHENMTIYKPYETSDPEFDTTNLKRFASHLPCPQLDEAMLHRYWKYGEADRWGKRRAPSLQFENRVADFLRHAVKQHRAQRSTIRAAIGLDVIGREGGQWTIRPDVNKKAVLCDGIHPSCPTLIRISSSHFAKLTHLDERELASELFKLANYVQMGDPHGALADLAAILLPDTTWATSSAPVPLQRTPLPQSSERVYSAEQLDKEADRTADLQRLV
jgi:hypothetical protein